MILTPILLFHAAKINKLLKSTKLLKQKNELRVRSTWPYTLSIVEGIKSDVRYLAPLLMVFFQTFRMALSHFVFSLLCVLNTSRKAYQLRLQLPLNQQLLMYSFLFPFLFFVLFTFVYPIKSKREDYYREYNYHINDNWIIDSGGYPRELNLKVWHFKVALDVPSGCSYATLRS